MSSGVWNLYRLGGNPFFQEPLSDDDTTLLRQMFVGRGTDLDLAVRTITHDSTTRAIIVGAPGVGKTTLLNRIRVELEAQRTAKGAPRFVTHSPAISIQGHWTTIDFCAEILRTILLMRAGTKRKTVSPTVLQRLSGILGQTTTVPTFWERVAQIVEGRQLIGLGITAGSVGGQVQPAWAAPVMGPASLLLLSNDAIRLLHAETGAEPVFFLNNLENLSRGEATHAAGLFQDARDLFLTAGSHWVVCGTTEVDATVIRASVQVGGIFPTALRLKPLDPGDVGEMLRKRYEALHQGPVPFIPPIEPHVGEALYRLYHGDLRNFLRLLQDAVIRAAGTRGATPISPEQIVGIMGREHAAAIAQDLGETSFGYFRRTVLGAGPGEPIWGTFTQAEAARRSGVSAPGFKRHMDQWFKRGYIAVERTDGRSEVVRLSGEAAIAFAALAIQDGVAIDPLLGTDSPLALLRPVD